MTIDRQLAQMSLEELFALSNDVKRTLKARQGEMRDQLGRMEQLMGSQPGLPKKRGVKKGTKLLAKYRGPNGEEWSGRGLRPIWLREQIKRGRREEHFLISKGR